MPKGGIRYSDIAIKA